MRERRQPQNPIAAARAERARQQRKAPAGRAAVPAADAQIAARLEALNNRVDELAGVVQTVADEQAELKARLDAVEAAATAPDDDDGDGEPEPEAPTA